MMRSGAGHGQSLNARECTMDDDHPTFVVEQDKIGSVWLVIATWPDGLTETIGGFASKEDAQAWIDSEAEGVTDLRQ